MHFKVKNLDVYFSKTNTSTAQFRLRTRVGSASEDQSEKHGAAHYLEHMLFKGTSTRSKHQISLKLGELGEANAFTDHDETAYHISTLPENSKEALELLFDMFFNSKLAANEFEKERNVILEECQMYEDDPSNFFYSNLMKASWGQHPIIGTKKSLINMTPKIIRDFIKEYYHSGNVALHIVGPFKLEVIKEILENIEFDLPDGPKYVFNDLTLDRSEAKFKHPAKQSMYGLVYPGISGIEDFKRNFVGTIFRMCLGGGFGSVLDEKIRDDMGLCYSIGCYPWSVSQNAITLITTMMDKKSIPVCSSTVEKIIKNVKKNGFKPETINYAKKSIKFRLSARADSPGAFIETFLKAEEELGYFVTPKAMASKVDKINNDSLIEFANEIMSSDPKLCTLNP